ncbi:rhodanese-like domain-containing protein [Actinocatenispora sera]|uniref:rhodanese-like domain-containing protein n=1 Tax=Actinocatenispora sera TaxID=390989 RepID=UPI00341179B4
MPAGSAEEIDVEVAAAAWAAGDLVLDVRTPEEYANGHVAGARNVPLSRLPAAARELPPGQLITVCTSGGRSWQAAQRLAALGRTALSVRGGTKAWRAAGHPVVAGPLPGGAAHPGPLRRLLSRRRR